LYKEEVILKCPYNQFALLHTTFICVAFADSVYETAMTT
jgi:hypothetical protein